MKLSVICFAFAACFSLGHTVETTCPDGLDGAKQAADSSNKLGWKIFANINKPDENFVISALSVSLAVALVGSGTNGSTREEIRGQLALVGSGDQDFSKLYEALHRQLKGINGDKVTLNIAHGIFFSQELNGKPEFLNHAKQCLDAQLEKVQFKTNHEEARRHINQWINDKTNSKIPELFKQGTIDGLTVAVLANALYLKAAWAHPFRNTENLPFYKLGRDETQTVPFMTQEHKLLYAENDKMQLVELPYDGEASISMFVFLPKERAKSLETLQQMGREQYRALFTNLTQQTVALKIPKFSIRKSISLKEVLRKIGIEKIFSDQADFSKLSDRPLKVSAAVHEAFIKINENGTEAAAASGVAITSRKLPAPPQVTVNFIADRPFVFSIVHKPTQATLFGGRVVKIEE